MVKVTNNAIYRYFSQSTSNLDQVLCIYILVNLVCAQYWCPLFCIQYCQKYFDNLTWLFKPFKFGNGSRMSDKKLIILGFKYLQNKKKCKQAVKSTRTRKSYWTYYFHFTQITDKNLQFPFKNWQFYHLSHLRSIHEALWMHIFVFLGPK